MQSLSFQIKETSLASTRKTLRVIREELAYTDRYYQTTSTERRRTPENEYSFSISDTKGVLSFCRFNPDSGELIINIGSDSYSDRYLASLVSAAMIEHRLKSTVGLIKWGRKVEASGGETLQGSLPLTYT